jgi:hypothetical protein
MRDYRNLCRVGVFAVKKHKKEPAMGTGPTGHPHP